MPGWLTLLYPESAVMPGIELVIKEYVETQSVNTRAVSAVNVIKSESVHLHITFLWEAR